MAFVEGDIFRHKLTGQLYEVKIVQDDTFILESPSSPYRMWFGEGDLKLLFEIAEKKRD
jgi:hypothetical protein